MHRIVDGVFPTHESRGEAPDKNDAIEIPEITEGELVRAVTSLGTGKVPGSHSISAKIVRRAVVSRPKISLDLFNECLRSVTFCDE